MANDQVLMSWQEMESAAKTCDKQSDAIKGIIRNMDGLVQRLDGRWKGDAYDAFQERWNSDLKKAFQDADDLMMQIAKALRTTSKTYQEVDRAAGQSLRNRG